MKHRDIKNLGVQRAYATFAVENVKEAGPGRKRTFTGIASTIEADLMEDIVVPEGAEFKLPLPLLYGHDSGQPIGWVRAARVKKDRIEVDCEVADVDEADSPELKKELAKRWTQLKSGLVRGLSIGFNPIETAQIDGSWGLKFLKWKWLELSAVVIAANQGSGVLSIKQIKSLSEQHLAALGRQGSPPGDGTRPGASGQQQQAASGRLFSSRSQKGKDTMKKTLKELLDLQATRVARQGEITKAWEDPDHTRTDEERTELREIDAELTTLDDEILMARMHQRHAAGASEVRGSNSEEGSRSRVPGGMALVKTQDPDDKFKGQSYVRFLKLKAMSRLTGEPISRLADYHGFTKSHPKFAMFVKAAVAGGGTGSGEWGAELARLDATYTGDFIEFLYGRTVFDRLPLKSVPARVRIKGQDGAFSANWVGESKGIPVSAGNYSEIDLTPLKVAAMAVISNELIEDSSPAADGLVMDGLSEAHSQKVDTTFFSAAAASAGVSPAGILNGVSALTPSGTDEAAVRADMQALAYPFVTAKMASGLMFVMNSAQGLSLGSFVNTFSQPSFPGINENGGTFMGRTALTGDNVTPGDIILLRPQDIWKIGDGGVQVSMSDTATIEMTDAPAVASDTPVAMGSHAVSMFQTESTAFKLVRRINFQKRRSNAVQAISNAEYGGVTS
jgi:hypothetical protein